MFGLGPAELGIIAVIVLIVFGPHQLPKLGRALGETKKALKDIHKEMDDET